MVCAKSAGIVTITARSVADSSKYATCEVWVNKKAIIIVPGIMGSEIYTKQQFNLGVHSFSVGDILWDPKVPNVLAGRGQAQIRGLKCGENGNMIYNTSPKQPVINNVNQNAQYGAMDTCYTMYNILYNKFYPEYDIVLYEYDWRKDPSDTALLLDDFIESHKYNNIIFVSHSMGGIVSSHYLALGQQQRNNVDKHITLGTPYLGSMLPIPIILTGEFLRDEGMKNWFSNLVGNFYLSNAVLEIIPNITSIYTLLPTEQYWKPYLSDIKKDSYSTYSDTIKQLKEVIPSWNNTLYQKAKLSMDSLFVGNRHISDYVESYYIVGDNENTTQQLYGKYNYDVYQDCSETKSKSGDGTVPLWSATIGGTTNSNRTFYKYSVPNKTSALHGDLMGKSTDRIITDNLTPNFVVEIIKEDINKYNQNELYIKFGIKTTKSTT